MITFDNFLLWAYWSIYVAG